MATVAAFIRILMYLLVSFVASGVAILAQTAHFTSAVATLPIGKLTRPNGMAIDQIGDVYVTDTASNSITVVAPPGTLDVGYYVTGDGSPYGIAVDASFNIYITDNVKNEVMKWTLYTRGSYGNSLVPFEGLKSPMGVAVDSQGNVYVADCKNNRVLKAAPSADGGYTQSVVPTTQLSLPEGVAVDQAGNLYIADTHNERVLKETPSGESWIESVAVNLRGLSRRPTSVAADAAGDLLILTTLSDGSDRLVFQRTLSRDTYSLTKIPSGVEAYAVAADAVGDAFAVSPGTNQLLEVMTGSAANLGQVVLPGASGVFSFAFTFDMDSTLSRDAVFTQGVAGLDFQDAGTGTCAQKKNGAVYEAGDSCTVDVIFKPQVSGSRYGAVVLEGTSGNPLATAYIYGSGSAPQIAFPPGKRISVADGLGSPTGVAVDAAGNVFVADSGAGKIYKERVFVPSYGEHTYSRTTVAAGLDHPSGMALDGAGNVYVLTSGAVYKETLSHGVYAQKQIVTDLPDLTGMAVDYGGNLYLTSSALGDVHKEAVQADGSYVETAIGYGISSPRGVAVDNFGDIFLINSKSNVLYSEMLQPDRSYQQYSFTLGITDPQEITVDGNGNVYVADGRGGIEELFTDYFGIEFGNTGYSGVTDALGFAVDGQENFYYARRSGAVTMFDVSDTPTLTFVPTKPGTRSVMSQTIANVGNANLDFPVLPVNTNPSATYPFEVDDQSTCPVVTNAADPGTLYPMSFYLSLPCTYSIRFAPPHRGSFSGTLFLFDNNLNVGASGPKPYITLQGSSTN